jgi:hypothetical protein
MHEMEAPWLDVIPDSTKQVGTFRSGRQGGLTACTMAIRARSVDHDCL